MKQSNGKGVGNCEIRRRMYAHEKGAEMVEMLENYYENV